MKKLFKPLTLVALLLALILCCTACDALNGIISKPEDPSTDEPVTDGTTSTPVVYSLVLTASKTELSRGDSVTLSSVLRSEGAEDLPSEDVVYSIAAGGNYATLVGNTLTVLNTAPHGATIKVIAREGATVSNEVTLTVSVPATELTVSANGVTNIIAGQSVVLSAAVAPEGAQSDIAWTITEGADAAVVSGNVLVINANAATGTVVKVQASVGNLKSTELSFTVGYPLSEISISAIGSLNLLAGNTAQVAVTLDPTNTTNGNYSLVFVNDCTTYASVSGNLITVSENAVTGSQIQVKAVAGDIESNVITYTVGYPLESLTIAPLGALNILPGNNAQVTVTLNPTNATNGNYSLVFVNDCASYASVSGNLITVGENAVTGSQIRVKAVAGNIESDVITYTVGYPLVSLTASISGSTNMNKGTSAQLAVSLNPANATNGTYEWVFKDNGGDYATVIGNVITINNDAPFGTVIELYAKAGDVESNIISILVGIPIEGITISSAAPEILDRGDSYPISMSVLPTNASTDTVTWVVSEGSAYAKVEGGVLYIDKATPAGTKVTLHAASGSVSSNELSYTVGIALESIEISADGITNIEPGSSAPISSVLNPQNATDTVITWVADTNADYVYFDGNSIFVKPGSPIGAEVTFHAEIGEVKSNSLTITVGTPLESIEISISGSTNVEPDSSKAISAVLNPTNASNKDIEWVVENNAEYVSIVNGVITVEPDAPIGAVVYFHAEIGEIKSNSLSITVGTPITGIEISALGSTDVVKGNSVGLSAVLTPSNASASLIEWNITAGAEYAEIRSNTLVISASAPTGATVKVQASFGEVVSNELEITVMATQEEINAQKYFLNLSNKNVTVDKNGTTTPTVAATIYNGNLVEVADLDVEYAVTDGAQYLSLEQDGNLCYFTATGHGNATVTATIVGTDISATIQVTSIVPPDAVAIPEVFQQRTNIEYAFSMIDPDTSAYEALAFVPTIRGGELVCHDYTLRFTHESGATGDDVATYADGAITFKMTGKVIATVVSTSGSRVEATASYTFNINEGYNVSTFQELNTLMRSSKYNGQIVNIVVTEKVIDTSVGEGETPYEYGYDLVPPTALLPKAEQTVAEIFSSLPNGGPKNRIQAVNKSVCINGNNHRIDGSQMRIFTEQEYQDYYNDNNVEFYFPRLSSIFSAEAWTTDGTESDATRKSFTVEFNNIEVVGNCPVTYDPTKYAIDPANVGTNAYGCYTVGISIGSLGYPDAEYYVNCKNFTSSGFKVGVNLACITDGKIENIHAYDCYSTGIVVNASIVTLTNMKFGACGACGIEVGPTDCDKAGANEDEKQQVVLGGTISADANLNKGDTNYFNNYVIMGYTIPMIISGNTQLYSENQVAHIMNANGQFIFVSLLMNDLGTFAANNSEVSYPAYQEGGIIDISALPTDGSIDTTHQYISMPIYVTISGQATLVGTAYFYNHNYGK